MTWRVLSIGSRAASPFRRSSRERRGERLSFLRLITDAASIPGALARRTTPPPSQPRHFSQANTSSHRLSRLRRCVRVREDGARTHSGSRAAEALRTLERMIHQRRIALVSNREQRHDSPPCRPRQTSRVHGRRLDRARVLAQPSLWSTRPSATRVAGANGVEVIFPDNRVRAPAQSPRAFSVRSNSSRHAEDHHCFVHVGSACSPAADRQHRYRRPK